jgi:hypothetical protein
MPLQPIEPTADELAKNVARQILQQIGNTAKQVAKLRADGVPAVAARAAQTLPDGRIIPAVEARPAVTGARIDAALGQSNVAILSALSTALGM